MSKKIMFICSSPRKKGNTNTLADWVAQAARNAGAQIEMVDAAHLHYKTIGCTACMGCQRSDKYECVIDDDAAAVIKRMPQFDTIVLATPIYWFGPSAQLKVLLDRTFALIKFDPKTAQPIANPFSKQSALCLLATAGGPPEEGLDLVDETFRAAAQYMGCRYDSLLLPLAPLDPLEMSKNTSLKDQAVALGNKLAAD
jgi:multimeric flavodoxin WrbA